jgi:ATP-dependent helicase/nuclease subunit A
LQGFVAWLRAAQSDVKRDMEISRDEVRVMTVHGAKGLEAPIVILADTTTPPAGPPQRQPRLLDLAGGATTPVHFVWAGPRANDVAAVATARDRTRRENEDEHRRLLYVAMTRAIDRLVVCGAEGERGRPPGCWWNLVADALRPLAAEEPAADGDGKVWRYCPTPPRARAGIPSIPAPPLPEPRTWLKHDAPREPLSVRPLAPSRAYDEEAPRVHSDRDAGLDERAKARARGVLLHRLLQSLPDVPPAARAEVARRHLARAAHDFSEQDRELVWEQARQLLDDPRFKRLFAPGSRAEVPVVARLTDRKGGAVAVSGYVDRLAVADDCVLIGDYKTGQPLPHRRDAYVAQLALYRAVLARLYPDRPVRAALIWTDVPDLMEISAACLDAALAAVTSP